jgi:multimeric flavodoxin WrbA
MYVIYRKVRLADCIVIASPIYFGHVTAQLKAMIDRFEVAWSDKYITDARRVPEPRSKQGIFICVSAEPKREYFNNAQKTVRFFFNTIGVDYKHGLWCPGLERAGDVTGKKHLIDKALRLGQRIVPKRKRRN